ncbi:MAG TPA: response regulator [Vicinamibacteria bacterium]|jgi:DNA-binding response OmpR family regulator
MTALRGGVGAARIVVVDDDPAVVRAVAAVLEADGYEVEGVGDQAEALRAVLQDPPALVVLDVNMPGLDGWELCDILRRQSHTRDVPVLFLTGRADLRDQITAMQVGGSDYVTKPFRPDELRAKVQAWVQRRRRKA